MNLTEAEIKKTYIIKEILINDDELISFLFSLGCYIGEPITVIKQRRTSCIVAVKEARYCIDKELAQSIII